MRKAPLRYEVEIMLGPTDPSHIMRTIEYWDIERYPAYDHIAVLVAEQVTATLSECDCAFYGQHSYHRYPTERPKIRVGNQVVLDFVKVLDQRQLREDDTGEAGGAAEPDVDRSTWEARVGATTMKVCDRITEIANEIADPKLELKYKKGKVALSVPGSFFNVLSFGPRRTSFTFDFA
jgi:hypothetical protein